MTKYKTYSLSVIWAKDDASCVILLRRDLRKAKIIFYLSCIFLFYWKNWESKCRESAINANIFEVNDNHKLLNKLQKPGTSVH